MDSEFMQQLAEKLAEVGLEVIRFEFPYMQKRREDGRKRPPDRMPILLAHLQKLINEYGCDDLPLYLAGKSMGGRVASMLLELPDVRSVFVFGYPFHPPGKPDKLRTGHLQTLSKSIHIFQGTRDAMGSHAEVEGYNLPSCVQVHWMEDGNHDLKPRVKSGFTQEMHLNRAVDLIGEFIS